MNTAHLILVLLCGCGLGLLVPFSLLLLLCSSQSQPTILPTPNGNSATAASIPAAMNLRMAQPLPASASTMDNIASLSHRINTWPEQRMIGDYVLLRKIHAIALSSELALSGPISSAYPPISSSTTSSPASSSSSSVAAAWFASGPVTVEVNVNVNGNDNGNVGADDLCGIFESDENWCEYLLRATPLDRGMFGEVWRAKRASATLSPSFGSFSSSFSSSSSSFSYILKRLLIEKGAHVLPSGLREIHFGSLLRGMPFVARFIESFEIEKGKLQYMQFAKNYNQESKTTKANEHTDPNMNESEGANADTYGADERELWLVFEDEGTSLQRYLFSIDFQNSANGGFATLSPSTAWKILKLESYGGTQRFERRSETHSQDGAVNMVMSPSISLAESASVIASFDYHSMSSINVVEVLEERRSFGNVMGIDQHSLETFMPNRRTLNTFPALSLKDFDEVEMQRQSALAIQLNGVLKAQCEAGAAQESGSGVVSDAAENSSCRFVSHVLRSGVSDPLSLPGTDVSSSELPPSESAASASAAGSCSRRPGYLFRSLFRQMVAGVAMIHHFGVMHRDIKLGNILIQASPRRIERQQQSACSSTHEQQKQEDSANSVDDESAVWLEVASAAELDDLNHLFEVGEIRFCDFGSAVDDWSITSSALYPSPPSQLEDTLDMAPPEVFFSDLPYHPNEKSAYDMWSLGVVFLQMLTANQNVFQLDAREEGRIFARFRDGTNQIDKARTLLFKALVDACIYEPAPTSFSAYTSWSSSADGASSASGSVPTSTALEERNRCVSGADEFRAFVNHADLSGVGVNDELLIDLLRRMLRWRAEDRLSAAQALLHPYFTGNS